jgi:uncharacterized protein YjbI with pentapeptide repeats
MQTVRPNTKVQTLDVERGKWKIWDVFPGRYSDETPDSEHMEVLVTALSKKGRGYWNEWRAAHPSVQPNLARIEFAVGQTPIRGPFGVDLSGYDLSGAIMNGCSLAFANLSGTRLCEAKLRESLINQSTIFKSDFSCADLTQASMSLLKCIETNFNCADLSRALLHESTVFVCNFDEADLEDASLNGALLNGSSFRNARLWSTGWSLSDLSGCNLNGADLSFAHFIKTKLGGADLTGARVYGVNCWDVEVSDETIQRDLIVTPAKDPTISVDDIRVAQFVHLILTNSNLRTVINTIGQKAVLILGRFGGGGIEVLRAVRKGLRECGYLPMIFEFARPEDKTYTDTVRTLAGLARFVVVDLSGPSVPQELYCTVPHTKIPFVPILEKGKHPYSMFVDLLEYGWVLRPIVEFESTEDLLLQLPERIIRPAETRIAIRQAKLRELFGSSRDDGT